MNLSILNFIVTEDCNFNCTYCRQKRGREYLSVGDIEKCIDLFYPRLSGECSVTFYGGEPLLAIEQIRHTVKVCESSRLTSKKKFRYTVTTNGSLMNREIIRFLDRHKFSVYLSFDGLAQETSRTAGSFKHILSIIPRLKEQPDIEISVISVFSPATVSYISKSISFILGLGIPKIRLSLDFSQPWDDRSISRLKAEFERLRVILYKYYSEMGAIPLLNFQDYEAGGIFGCAGGETRLALTPGGILWGCHRVWSHFCGRQEKGDYHKYNFGKLDEFIQEEKTIYPKIMANYANLRQDYSWTPEKFCIECEEVRQCDVCPFSAASSGCVIGKIPAWVCTLIQLERKERKKFLTKISPP